MLKRYKHTLMKFSYIYIFINKTFNLLFVFVIKTSVEIFFRKYQY